MRTKTLLIAATALAIGVGSSMAQTYSQNVVGYVNVVIPGGGISTLIENPLNGTTNDIQAVIPGLQDAETISIWQNTGTVGYLVYVYHAGAKAGGNPSDWTDGGGVAIVPNLGDPNETGYTFVPSPIVNPGTGFFITEPGNTFTNTFTGTVILSNSNSPTLLLGGGISSLVGSTAPVGGSLQTNSVLGLPLQDAETVSIWQNSGTVGYLVYVYHAGAQAGGNPSDWTDGGGVAIVPNLGDPNETGYTFVNPPSVTIGQGIFYNNPASNTHWTNTVVLQ